MSENQKGFNLDRVIDWADIIKGVGSIIIDEAKVALHGIFDHLRSPGISEHFITDTVDGENGKPPNNR